MAENDQGASDIRLYSSGTLPQRSGFFGLSLKVTIIGMIGLIVALIVVVTFGLRWGLLVAAVVATLAAPVAIRIGHRSLFEWMQIRFQWRLKSMRGQNVYKAGPHSRVPGGRNRLPGLLAGTTLHESIDSNGNYFGMIRRKARNEYTVVLECQPSGDEALTTHETDLMTADWGRYLAGLGLPGDIAAAVAVVETLPATGLRMIREVEAATAYSNSDIATQVMHESALTFPQGKTEMVARLAITFRATTRERRLDPEAMAAEIATRLPALYEDLAGAGVTAIPMNANDITAFVHRSHVPASEADLEELAVYGEPHGLEWEDAGPSGWTATARSLHHSGVTSTTWEMSAAPESVFPDDALRPLLNPHPRLLRKRVAIVYRPVNAGDATKQVDREYKDSIVALNQGKAVKSAAAEVRLEETKRARQEQVRGAGLVRYSLLVTATYQEQDEGPVVASTVQSLAARTRLRLLRSYGMQDAAFHASLGVGVLLPDHSSISKAMSDQ